METDGMSALSQLCIIHSCTSRSFSGAEQYAFDLALWQTKQGHKVIFYCRAETDLARRLKENGVSVWTIGENEKYGPRLWMKMKSRWREVLAKNEKAVLHLHAGGELWYHFPWLSQKRGRRKNLRTIFHPHIWINHYKKDPLHAFLYSKLTEVWTSSSSSKQNFLKRLPINEKKIRVVPYGRDFSGRGEYLDLARREKMRSDFRKKIGASNEDTLFLCIARFELVKGIEELLVAFEQLYEREKKIRLVLIGGPSPENRSAERYAYRLQDKIKEWPEDLKARLHMPGFISPVEPYYLASDVYVLPSYEECMSLALLDAAVFGLPVVGTNSGGTPSVVIPGETGFLVSPRNALELKEAMEKLAAPSQLRKQMAERIMAMGKKFDREHIFRDILGFYLELF